MVEMLSLYACGHLVHCYWIGRAAMFMQGCRTYIIPPKLSIYAPPQLPDFLKSCSDIHPFCAPSNNQLWSHIWSLNVYVTMHNTDI